MEIMNEMTEKIVTLMNLSSHPLTSVFVLSGVLILGLAWCFFGVHGKRAFSSIALALGFYLIGAVLSQYIPIAGYEWMIPLFIGIIGAFLGGILPKVGTFVMIGVSGMMALSFILEGFRMNVTVRLIIAIAVGIFFAVLGMKYDPAVIIASALFGAFCFIGVLSKNVQLFSSVPNMVRTFLSLGIAAGGVVCQSVGKKA